jgi:hypothetical protein
MTAPDRDRVTVDLRGLGERLRAQAAAQRMATGAFVRRAVALQLDFAAQEPTRAAPVAVAARETFGPIVKVTIRLSAADAVALATRAREADTSQGAYVAGLLDGCPLVPVPPNRAEAITALVASTDLLASLGADISSLTRFLRQANVPAANRYRERLEGVHGEVQAHLKKAADLFREIIPARPTRAGVMTVVRSIRKR